MTFDTNLKTFNFNKETLSLLTEDGLERNEILDTMEEVGFSKDLTTFLLDTKPTFFNSIIIRLKLYAKKNTKVNVVHEAFSQFPKTLSLVNHLYETDQVEEKCTDIQMLEEDIVDVDSATEDDNEEVPLDLFINTHITEKQGSKLSVKETYDVFVQWYNEKYQEEEPDRKEFKKYLTEKLGKGSKSSWKNYALVA